MKYTDFKKIPQYTSVGSYQVNMELRYLVEWIDNETKEMGLQLNPDFQRGHVWNEEQQVKFIEYLLSGGKSGRVLYFNCPSWMGRQIINGYDDYVCVDGLQRLTAIMRFMNNEIKVFDSFYNEYENKIPRDIDMLVNVNNLTTKKEVLHWYVEMNEGGTPHTKDEIERVKHMIETVA